MKYGSGKCVSSIPLASLGTGTSMNALNVEVNSRFWRVRREERGNESSDASFS